MSIAQINCPTYGVLEKKISFKNTSGAALAHGDVVVKDFATMVTEVASATDGICRENAKSSTTAGDSTILGVVHDPAGFGVADGALGELVVRGFAKVKVALATAVTALTTLKHSGTALTAVKITAATTLVPGLHIGTVIKGKTLTTVSTVDVFVDLK